MAHTRSFAGLCLWHREGAWGRGCLEGLFVGTAAHYVPDEPCSLRYLLSPGYLLGDLGAEVADLVNCAKQDGESHPGGAAASCPARSRNGGAAAGS